MITGFDPKPENRDTSVVDGAPRSWLVQQTDNVLHLVTNTRFLYLHNLVNFVTKQLTCYLVVQVNDWLDFGVFGSSQCCRNGRYKNNKLNPATVFSS